MPGLMDLAAKNVTSSQPEPFSDNYRYTIAVEPLVPGIFNRMKVTTIPKRKEAVKQLDTGEKNPTVTLVFSCGEDNQKYDLPYKVIMNFCPAVELAVNKAALKVTSNTVLTLTVEVDNLVCVPAVMDYLATYKTIIDDRGRVKGIGKADNFVLSTYNETMKVANALGMSLLANEMEAYLHNLQYKAGMPSWTIHKDDLEYLLEHSVEGYWLRKEVVTSIAKAKQAKVLRNHSQIMKFLRRDHERIYDIVVKFIKELVAIEKSQKETERA